MERFPHDARPLGSALKTDFVGLEGLVHLAAGGETPLLERHRDVFDRYARLKGQGKRGLAEIENGADRARGQVARLLGGASEDVGFSYNVSQANNMVARAVRATGPGNVVIPQWEYPSMIYPWMRVADPAFGVRLLRSSNNRLNYESLADLVDDDTKAIVVSHVSYLTGERVDLARLRAIADRAGAMLVVDASHSLGVVQSDWSLADFVFSCCYKWLLGCHGVSIAWRNPHRLPEWMPVEVGWANVEWHDAAERGESLVPLATGRMFELGIPGLLAASILGEALEYLAQFSGAEVEKYVLRLSGDLMRGLAELGLSLMTPLDDAQRAGNVAFPVPDQEQWRQYLEDADILCWTSDQRVRLSTFIYNDDTDVARALDVIARAVARWGVESAGRSAGVTT